MEKKENEKSLNEILDAGIEIFGSVTGAFIGGAVAGPIGLALGAAFPTILIKSFKKIRNDVLSRNISKREEQKIGAGYYFALKRIESNISRGMTIRKDGFINDEDILSDSNTILEGVTVQLQKEWELKKLEFYGNFLGNISFRPDININYATVLLRLIESLSYRQICIVAIFKRIGTPEIDLSSIESRFKTNYAMHNFSYSLYSDLVELGQLSVLRRVAPFKVGAVLGNCVLSDIGEKLFELMNLTEICKDDYIKTKRELENML